MEKHEAYQALSAADTLAAEARIGAREHGTSTEAQLAVALGKLSAVCAYLVRITDPERGASIQAAAEDAGRELQTPAEQAEAEGRIWR